MIATVALALSTGGVATTRTHVSAAGLRDSIVAIAQRELNDSGRNREASNNCNFYSGYWVSGSSGCATPGFRSNAWCADFARYVWKIAGVADLGGLDSWAYSFWRYGVNKGTWHLAGSGYIPQPGDAVVFDWDTPWNPNVYADIDHVGVVEYYSSGVVHTIEGNTTISGQPDGVARKSRSGGSIVGFASPVGAGATNGGSGYANGTVLREPSGAIGVIAGGAIFNFQTVAEITEAGYGSTPYVNVSDGFLSTLPTQPQDGTLVRRPNGWISVVAGGAKFGFATVSEVTEAGYGGLPFTTVPTTAYDALTAVPNDGTLIRRPNGWIAVTAGGAKFGFATMQEVTDAGYGGKPFVTVPTTGYDLLTTVPNDGTLIRRPNGWIAVTAGGAKFGFATMQEVTDAGYGGRPFVSVPMSAYDALTSTPRDGALIRRPNGWISATAGGAKFSFATMDEVAEAGYSDQNFVTIAASAYDAVPVSPQDGALIRRPNGWIAVTAGGAKFGFATMQEVTDAGYGGRQFTNVPTTAFDLTPNTARDGTLVRAPGDSQIWRIVSGVRSVTSAPGGQTVTTIPQTAFSLIPTA